MEKSRLLSAVVVILLNCTLFFFSCSTKSSQKEIEETDSIPSSYLLDICIDSLDVEDMRIQRGENLGSILTREGISPIRIDSLQRLSKDVFDVTKMKAGYRYQLLSDINNGEPQFLIYEKSLRDHIVFDLRDTLRVYEYQKDVTLQSCHTGAVIETSLWNAVKKAGSDMALSEEMAEIYAWQIDFFGIDKGDYFKVLYTQAYIDDSVKMEIGDIRGAIFNYHGKDYYAIPFMQDSILAYYDENGNSIRKAFLKAPLKFSRISSKFSHARRHPILKIVRPHHGVDYAAPTGTPVRAIGDGVISKKAFQRGGAGNYIRIKHNSNYETSYMHLSRFAKGIKAGRHVTQGEIIGYVGSTGSSTGPHLDFRVYRQGKPINPLKMDSPPTEPVREELRDSFMVVRDQVINELKQIKIN